MKIAAIALLLAAVGCATPEEAFPDAGGLPACDTLTTVFFVSRCDQGHARCALKSTAPAGSVASGCELTIISQPSGTPEQVECTESCE